MASTTTDLFRRGNASGPRMTHVRVGVDVTVYVANGVNWVLAGSGGISTFSEQGPGTNWWLLPAGFDYADELVVVNDHGNHFSWEPKADMTLADFVRRLALTEQGFRKVS